MTRPLLTTEQEIINVVGKKIVIRTMGDVLVGIITSAKLFNYIVSFFTTIQRIGYKEQDTIKSIQYRPLPDSDEYGWCIYTEKGRYDDFDVDIV